MLLALSQIEYVKFVNGTYVRLLEDHAKIYGSSMTLATAPSLIHSYNNYDDERNIPCHIMYMIS